MATGRIWLPQYSQISPARKRQQTSVKVIWLICSHVCIHPQSFSLIEACLANALLGLSSGTASPVEACMFILSDSPIAQHLQVPVVQASSFFVIHAWVACCLYWNAFCLSYLTCCNISVSPAASALPAAEIESLDPDPLDTERFASASDYSKGENFTSFAARAQLQKNIRQNKQRVRLDVLHVALSCKC